MGEFIVETQVFGDKMGEPALEESVSFGRFENDSLSWEKWSTFSPNRYLEEVEKCATPGSVAQKKAYFEAHYKKIAARKAELLDQQEKDPLGSDDQNVEDLTRNCGGVDSELDVSYSQSSFAEETKQVTDFTGEVNCAEGDTPFVGDVEVAAASQSSTVDKGKKEDVQSGSHCLKVSNHEEPEDVKEQPQNVGNETPKVSEVNAKTVKLHHPKESKKLPLVSKGSGAANSKRKPVLPMHKASPISTKKAPKTTDAPSKALPAGSSTRKGTSPSPSLSRSKYTSTAARQGVGNKSLHMSLSLSATTPDTASPTSLRKSFILEKMGDKDIVKRAFKTFQNNYSQSKVSSVDGSSVRKQVSTRRTDTGISTSTNMAKENGRPTKAKEVSKKGAVSVSTSFGLKSDIREEKRKEKKLEEESKTKEAERTRLQSKSQEGKEADIKKHRKNLNFKATPMPGFYQKQKTLKSTSDKGSLGTGTQINPPG